jgi:hypothetical protein
MPDLIKNIIPEVINKLSSGNPEWQNSLTRTWEAIADSQAKKHTAIAGLRKGRLLINVDSPVWVFQLTLKKGELLRRLQRDFPELSAISFRIGKIH